MAASCAVNVCWAAFWSCCPWDRAVPGHPQSCTGEQPLCLARPLYTLWLWTFVAFCYKSGVWCFFSELLWCLVVLRFLKNQVFKLVGWEPCGEVSALGNAAPCFSLRFPESYFVEWFICNDAHLLFYKWWGKSVYSYSVPQSYWE